MRSFTLPVCCCLFLLAGCQTVSHQTTNPQFSWTTSGSADGGLPPRNQISRPGGTGVYPDTGEEQQGRATGVIFLGPAHTTDDGFGATDSTATTTFRCGGGQGDCVVNVTASSHAVGPGTPFGDDEYLVLTLSGGGATDTKRHRGNSSTNSYVLSVPGCGDVTLTVTFEETVNGDNPPGIQTKFTSRVNSYGCN